MTIRTKLQGDSMQVAVVQLEPGQMLYAEAGKFLWKTTNVTSETRATKPSDGTEAPPPPPGADPSVAGDAPTTPLPPEPASTPPA